MSFYVYSYKIVFTHTLLCVYVYNEMFSAKIYIYIKH